MNYNESFADPLSLSISLVFNNDHTVYSTIIMIILYSIRTSSTYSISCSMILMTQSFENGYNVMDYIGLLS